MPIKYVILHLKFVIPIRNIYIDFIKFNETIRNLQLGYTLQLIAKTNVTEFYNGSLARMIVSEINENGGNVTLDDFKSYSADITDAVEVEVDDDNTVYTHPLPSSGILVPFIMRIMKGKRKVLLADIYTIKVVYLFDSSY